MKAIYSTFGIALFGLFFLGFPITAYEAVPTPLVQPPPVIPVQARSIVPPAFQVQRMPLNASPTSQGLSAMELQRLQAYTSMLQRQSNTLALQLRFLGARAIA